MNAVFSGVVEPSLGASAPAQEVGGVCLSPGRSEELNQVWGESADFI